SCASCRCCQYLHSCVLSVFRYYSAAPRALHSFPTRRSSDLIDAGEIAEIFDVMVALDAAAGRAAAARATADEIARLDAMHDELRSEEHTSELQSRENLVCRLLLEKKTKAHESP